MSDDRKYWFPAKWYGWGWGIPSSWQGWAVLVTFMALVAVGALVFPPDTQRGLYLTFVGVCSLMHIVVCWMKGEPPRWRWGGR